MKNEGMGRGCDRTKGQRKRKKEGNRRTREKWHNAREKSVGV